MYCFTKNVAGDLADVEMIVPPGVPARGFEPTARQQQEILRADLVVENGFGFEPWIDKLVTQGLKPGATRVIAARGTGPGIPGLPGDPNTPPGDSPPDVSEPPDPHVWLDPLMAIKEVQNIRDALMARDPVHADEFLANENRYEATLRDLEDEVGRMTVAIPKRRLLCVDKTFTYFLSHFEFPTAKPGDEADAVLELVNTDPKGWHLKGSRFVKADPMECGPASTDFYERVMRANAEALREGLAQ
jgi:ABC-type Zn uptake system ZnuABC Zn-binding protein ZnuA